MLNIYTDGGNRTIGEKECAGGGTYILDGAREIVYSAKVRGDQTNNRGELTGFIYGLKYILQANQNAKMTLDSQYVLKGAFEYMHGWKKKQWITATGEPVKNQDLWQEVDLLLTQIKERGIKIETAWVKGHTGVRGNEMADQAATAAVLRTAEGNFTEEVVQTIVETPAEVLENPDSAIPQAPTEEEAAAKKEKKVKLKGIPEPHPWIAGRRLLSMSHVAPFVSKVDGRHVYLTASYNDKDKELKGRAAGVTSGEVFEGVLLSPEQCPVLEKLREYQNRITPPYIERPVIIHWDVLKTQRVWEAICLDEDSRVFREQRNNVYAVDEDTLVSEYMRIPRLTQRLVDSCWNKVSVYERLKAGTLGSHQLADITNVIYDEETKGKKDVKIIQKVKGALRTATAISIPVVFGKKETKLQLALGYEIPDRNYFSRVVKSGRVTVKVLIYDILPQQFHYLTIIEDLESGNTLVCDNPHTCVKYVL